MKKLLTIASILATSLIFTACGGGGGGATTAVATTAAPVADTYKIVPLTIGEATAVEAGYSVVESSDDAVLDILVAGETKVVTLTVGSASLKMPI